MPALCGLAGDWLPDGMWFAIMAALCLGLLFAVGMAAQQPGIPGTVDNKPTFTTFDVPSAGTGANQGTIALSINGLGIILTRPMRGTALYVLPMAQ